MIVTISNAQIQLIRSRNSGDPDDGLGFGNTDSVIVGDIKVKKAKNIRTLDRGPKHCVYKTDICF